MQDIMLTVHDEIYSAGGICKDWEEAKSTVARFKTVVEYFEDMECHILEGDLKEVWLHQELLYQKDKY